MITYWMSVQLLSDATFGSGSGIAGLVDVEIEHDADGLPFLGARALKGLLVEEYANIRHTLATIGHADAWDDGSTTLFGRVGATDVESGQSRVRYGAALLPEDLREALAADVAAKLLRADEVLGMFTTIRRQTSIDTNGAPETGSLRSMRALLRGTPLLAKIESEDELNERERGLLAACALGVRRAGVSRNRGRGKIALRIHLSAPQTDEAFDDQTTTDAWFNHFATEVQR